MNLRAYRALIQMDLRLALRNRTTIFFSYLMPLILFAVFGFTMHGEGMGSYVVCTVLVMGILSSGLMGGGIRAVQEREQNILRRFRVAPISPLPLLVASAMTGLIIYIPSVPLFLRRLVAAKPAQRGGADSHNGAVALHRNESVSLGERREGRAAGATLGRRGPRPFLHPRWLADAQSRGHQEERSADA